MRRKRRDRGAIEEEIEKKRRRQTEKKKEIMRKNPRNKRQVKKTKPVCISNKVSVKQHINENLRNESHPRKYKVRIAESMRVSPDSSGRTGSRQNKI